MTPSVYSQCTQCGIIYPNAPAACPSCGSITFNGIEKKRGLRKKEGENIMVNIEVYAKDIVIIHNDRFGLDTHEQLEVLKWFGENKPELLQKLGWVKQKKVTDELRVFRENEFERLPQPRVGRWKL